MNTLLTRPLRRYGCWGCGCLAMALLVLTLACVGAFTLLTGRTPIAHAAQLDIEPRPATLLIDQSRSVTGRTSVQELAHLVTGRLVEYWRAAGQPNRLVRVLAFGSRLTTVVSATSIFDPALDPQLTRFFDAAGSLGGTAYLPVVSALLNDIPAGSDLILITDGIPDPVGDPASYARQIDDLAPKYAQHAISTSILLIGEDNPTAWLPMWRDFAQQTKGVMVEVKSADMITQAIEALPRAVSTHTPAPTRLLPSPTLTPTHTPAPTPSPSPLVIVPPSPPADAASPTIPWLVVGLMGLWVAAMAAFATVLWKGRHTPKQPEPAAAGDEGVLDILDPDHDAWRRVELQQMAVGEVWLIGNASHCPIRFDDIADEAAAIVMTPDGPQIDQRGAPLVVDGRFTSSHRLFDNDEVYIGRLIVLYQNFFRQRPSLDADADSGAPFQPPSANVQPLTANPRRIA